MEQQLYPATIRAYITADFTEGELFFLKALKMPFESCKATGDSGYVYSRHFYDAQDAIHQMHEANKMLLQGKYITKKLFKENEDSINKRQLMQLVPHYTFATAKDV